MAENKTARKKNRHPLYYRLQLLESPPYHWRLTIGKHTSKLLQTIIPEYVLEIEITHLLQIIFPWGIRKDSSINNDIDI